MPPSFKTVCVYCASSADVDDVYKEAARDLGQLCAQSGKHIVYGGGHVGLMGVLADSALAAGGEVTGVIPQLLMEKEVAHRGLTHLYQTQTMQERQLKMAELSDAFVVLPGGTGTLAEFFEVLTWKQLGLHDKPIAVLNIGGYWDFLLKTLDFAREQRFIKHNLNALYDIFCDMDAFRAAYFNI
ncbi:MAG: TIGR00730 family Rossman fold protein [Bdellovibrionales bacterium]